MIVRYGSMLFTKGLIAIIGAGRESEKDEFKKKIQAINNQYRFRSDFVDPDKDKWFGAITEGSYMADMRPPKYFALFTEFELAKMTGNNWDKCKLLESRLKDKFKDSAKTHLVIYQGDNIVQLNQNIYIPTPFATKQDEVRSYMKASLDEFIRLDKK